MHEECGNLAAAAEAFERANEKAPTNVDYLISMARVYNLLDRKASAAEVWQLVWALQPNHPKVHRRLGALYRSLGRPEKVGGFVPRSLAQLMCWCWSNSHAWLQYPGFEHGSNERMP